MKQVSQINIQSFIRKYWRYLLLGFLILIIWIIRFSPFLGEAYATTVYPLLSAALSSFSSHFPFSLGDIFIFLSFAGIIVYPFWGWYNKVGWKKIVLRIGEYLLWVYVWFYFAWGMTYFRSGFYTRTEVTPVPYSAENFRSFLDNYVENLNREYIHGTWVDHYLLEEEVKAGYITIHKRFGLCKPRGWQRPKTMLFTDFISKVGVTGYMGPFFSEFNLNGDLLSFQYPSTYAHEMAHLLGISSEAEANLYAYLVCTSSNDQHIRFSGYFSLFVHVLRNARGALSEEEYEEFIAGIRPEVIELYKDKITYWNEKYSPFIGEIQSRVYDWFLKGNQIESGRENYSQVVGLIISLEQSEKN